MPGRNASSSDYRYGFNKGSEKDDEITGVTGAHFTTYFREGDTRLLRWWSNDPKAKSQPWQSPYSYMDGNPIWFNDPFGDKVKNGVSSTVKEKENDKSLAQGVYNNMLKGHQGELKQRHKNKYRKDSGLKAAEKSLSFWQGKEKRVNDMISTFAKTNPNEFNF